MQTTLSLHPFYKRFYAIYLFLFTCLAFTLSLCNAFRSMSLPLSLLHYFCFSYIFTAFISIWLSLQTILLWRRQSKTWPPCINLVDLRRLAHECTCLPPVPLNLPLSSTFPHLSWHSFYVFFTSSFTSHQRPPALQYLWASLLLKEDIHLCTHLSSFLYLFPLPL